METEVDALAERFKESLAFAKNTGQLKRDPEAAALWRQVYPDLSEGCPGLLGAVISRAEPQVTRLACVYAVLDLSATIGKEHLQAALALWKYSEDSARFVFGDRLGDPVADKIHQELQATPQGMTLSEIHDLFGRHAKAGEILSALTSLSELGLAHCRPEPTGGRSAERWYSSRHAK